MVEVEGFFSLRFGVGDFIRSVCGKGTELQ